MFEEKYDYENIILDEDVVDKTKSKKSGKLILTNFRLVFCENKGIFGGGKTKISKEFALSEIKTVDVEWGEKLGILKVGGNKQVHEFVIADPLWEIEMDRAVNTSYEVDKTPEGSNLDEFTEKITIAQFPDGHWKGEITIDGKKVVLKKDKLYIGFSNVTIPINKIRDIRFDKLLKGNVAKDILFATQSKWICIDYFSQKGLKTIGILGNNSKKSNIIIRKLIELWDPSKNPPLIHEQTAEKIDKTVKGIGGMVLSKVKGKTCSKCGTQAGRKEIFCPNCGASLEDEKASKLKCSGCGTDLIAGVKYCGNCGTEVKMILYCSNCGAELETGSKFCVECGTQVDKDASL